MPNSRIDFRRLADACLDDIVVSEELREKTLARCRQAKYRRSRYRLAAAACLLLILGTVRFSGLLSYPGQPPKPDDTGIDLLVSPDDGSEVLPGSESGPMLTWQLPTPNEAAGCYTGRFLTPDYLPAGFTLSQIRAYGADYSAVAKIVLTYVAGERSFLIIEENDSFPYVFTDYEAVTVNGADAYLKSNPSGATPPAEAADTELHWLIGDDHYAVMGRLSAAEAINIAETMK